MDTKAKTYRFWKLSGSAAGLLVLLVILVAVNVIVSGMRVRKDLTQEKLYTLTDGYKPEGNRDGNRPQAEITPPRSPIPSPSQPASSPASRSRCRSICS